MPEQIVSPRQQSNHGPILAILASLIAGSIPGGDAIEQLTMLKAEPWLIQSVRRIEAMFKEEDPSEWYGPLDEVVRKVQGEA